jgi:HSP20 family molecular chaperone IbpA
MYVVRRRGARNIERLQHQMEDTFHALLASGRPVKVLIATGASPAWRPQIEVYETDEALVVLAEIAGMVEDDLEVEIDDAVLSIRGTRQPLPCEGRRTVHEMGILYGPFAAEVYLPFSIDQDEVDAAYEAGMLRVRLPRLAATRIDVAVQQG